jgi:hypothetical protein
VAKLREKISVSKRENQKSDLERFDLRMSGVVDNEMYHVENSNRFAALEIVGGSLDINNAWESIKKSRLQQKKI